MPNYCYQCTDCGSQHDEMRDYEDRDNPATCDQCGSLAERVYTAPNITRASFVDGKRRFTDIKTANQLKKQKSAARGRGDRVEEKKLNQEIKKVEKKI